MNTIEIAGQTYERRPCWCDDGTVHDATNADKVCTGGKAVGTCSHCRGEGETFHLLALRDTSPREPSTEPIGEMPDWML
jgi:hypothetical protein